MMTKKNRTTDFSDSYCVEYDKESKQFVIGLAKGYDEAVEVAASVIDEVYRQTGAFEVASYLREKRRRKAE